MAPCNVSWAETDLNKTKTILLQNIKRIKLAVWKANSGLKSQAELSLSAFGNVNINTYKATLKYHPCIHFNIHTIWQL